MSKESNAKCNAKREPVFVCVCRVHLHKCLLYLYVSGPWGGGEGVGGGEGGGEKERQREERREEEEGGSQKRQATPT